MKTTQITTSILALSFMALGACEGGDTSLEPGDLVEVYHQDDNGNQTTLGYYEPDTQLFNQTPIIWDFEGYWFEAGEELLEVRGTDSGLQAEVALEVGATYDANLLQTASDDIDDALTQGVVVVDTVAAELSGGFSAASTGCRLVSRWGKMQWSKGNCRQYSKYVCSGGNTFIQSRKTHLGYCIKN